MNAHETTRPTETAPDGAQHVLVAGGGRLGLATASSLGGRVNTVSFVGEVPDWTGAQYDVDHHEDLPSDVVDVRELKEQIGEVDVVLVLGPDPHALYMGYLCRREFGPALTVASLEDPSRRQAFEDSGVDPVEIPELLAERVLSNARGVDGG